MDGNLLNKQSFAHKSYASLSMARAFASKANNRLPVGGKFAASFAQSFSATSKG